MTVSDKLDTTSSLVLIREASMDGEISVDWSEFRAHLKIRLEENYQYFKTHVHAGVDPENKKLFLTPEDKDELNNQIERILILISSMPSQPFTLQRLCELLSEPDRYHPTLPRYLKAITKLCRVPTRAIELGSDDIDVDEVALSMIDIEREKRTWRSGSEPPPLKRARSVSPEGSKNPTSFISHSVPNSPRPSSNLNGHQLTPLPLALRNSETEDPNNPSIGDSSINTDISDPQLNNNEAQESFQSDKVPEPVLQETNGEVSVSEDDKIME